MISQSVEYSMRAMISLAHQHGQAVTVKRISELANIPAPYLAKLMQMLARGGLVQSRRGLGGGFLLTREPQEITIWDIVEVVEPLKRIRSCPLGIEGHQSLCPLHKQLDDYVAMIEDGFRKTSLQDLLQHDRDPLCKRETPVMGLETLSGD